MNGSFITGDFSQIHEKSRTQATDHHLSQVKEESTLETESTFSSPGLEFNTVHQASTTASIKVNGGEILQEAVIPISSHVSSFTSTSDVFSASKSHSKSLTGQTIMPVTIQPSSLSISTVEPGTIYSNSGSIVAASTSACTLPQPVQMFQTTSFENCDNVLTQQQSGQTFLLTPSGTVIPSPMVSQGQVFLQGDNLVGVPLSASSPQFTSTSPIASESQFNSNVAYIQGNPQNTMSGVPARIIIQTNQPNATVGSISQPILSSNNNHYLIQVGNNYASSPGNSNLSFNSKGHIVIKSRGNKIKSEPRDLSSQSSKDGIFRVVIPEGTTKITRPSQPADTGNVELKKYVQINVSNAPVRSLQTKGVQDRVEVLNAEKAPMPTIPEKTSKGSSSRKLYECTICSSKFMRPLYLRMHMRSCKKPEVKVEKTPLFMCSFCKATFKSKQQINLHFPICLQNPCKESNMLINKNLVEGPPVKKGKLEMDPSLEQAVQYKCQDCDRTFSKERQYTSHIKRCTKFSVHDLSGAKAETVGEEHREEEIDSPEDPFADPPVPIAPPKRGRGSGGRRGRPPGRISASTKISTPKTNSLFEDKLTGISNGLVVADNENLVRSTTGLAHTVQLSLDMTTQRGTLPNALVANAKGVRGREKPPQVWSLVCSLCQKMFLTKAALATHVINFHGTELHTSRNILLGKNEDNKESYRCPLCMHHYNTSDGFIEHLVLQHTIRLRESFRNLQAQTGSFVCSLCSLVLLTRTLLMEHLSLEHLDELEACVQTQRLQQQRQTKAPAVYLHPGVRTKLEPEDEDEHSQDKWSSSDTSTPPLQSTQSSWEAILPGEKARSEPDSLECSFCGDEIPSREQLIEHYTEVHGVETDTDGTLLDLGIDVDIKVKDTRSLLHMANGVVDEKSSALPDKTVLIRKKPKQSWQCQICSQVFNRQSSYVRHVREICGVQESSKVTSGRESNFFCPEKECSHLAFSQVKSLFKHMEDVHAIIVRRERKSFKQLSLFYQWLEQEEKKSSIKFVKENAKYERSNVKLIQMVCQKFHSAQVEQAKEKKAELSKPTKKRWSVRGQRSSNCLARIHLRVEFNDATNDYDGETQMIYYPEHSHSDEEDNSDAIDKMMIRHPKTRALGNKNNGAMNQVENEALSMEDSNSLETGRGPLTQQVVDTLSFESNEVDVSFSDSAASQIAGYTSSFIVPENIHTASPAASPLTLQEKLTPKKKTKTMNAPTNSPIVIQSMNNCATNVTSSLILSSPSSTLSQGTQVIPAATPMSSSAIILEGNEPKLVIPNGTESQSLLVQNDIISSSNTACSSSEAKTSLVESGGVGSFIFQDSDIVVDMNQPDSAAKQTGNGSQPLQQPEYILPADESEWVKLFDVLKARINAMELSDDEKKEAEAVITYQNVISMISLHEQVSIFQKLCSLINTSLESV